MCMTTSTHNMRIHEHLQHADPNYKTISRSKMLSKRQRPYDPARLDPTKRLRRNMSELFSRNELPANRIGELCADVNRVAPTQLADVGRPCTQKNIARLLKSKFGKQGAWMPDYIATLRVWDTKSQSIKEEKVPIQLLHEIVAVLKKYGSIDKIMETANMDPLTKEHLVSCEAKALCKLLGIGIWGDGAPTQWERSQSIDVISVSFPGSVDFKNLRIPLLSLPHSKVCHETWEDVFEIVKWSLVILATGTWPLCRHDGTAWNNTDKCRKTARPLIRSALVEVRQEWKFAAEVFGLPAHNTVDGCCWACNCTLDEVPWGSLFNNIYNSHVSEAHEDAYAPVLSVYMSVGGGMRVAHAIVMRATYAHL